MVEAKNNFDNQAISLSLYYRKENQEPIIINEWQLPDINFLPENFINKNISQDVEKALSIRPEIQIIKIKQQQEQNNLSQAQNLYKPNLNLNFEASKDLGNGSKTRSQTNNEVKLNFEVPLQQNIAKGKILQSNSKINLLKIEESFYRDKITNEIKQISNSIQTSAKIFNNYLQEYKLSQQLEKAERERFRSGNSDFFLINLREQEMASAKINKLVSFFKYQSLKADYQVAIFNNE
jgi:outer membrane protein TolC